MEEPQFTYKSSPGRFFTHYSAQQHINVTVRHCFIGKVTHKATGSWVVDRTMLREPYWSREQS